MRKRAGKTKSLFEVTADSIGKNPCSSCIPAKCCMYFSIEIDRPESISDFEDILWIIAHEDVEIYTYRRRWFAMVRNPCRFYDPSRGCSIYESRPRICRNHKKGECELNGPYDFDLHFRSYDEFARFVEREKERKKYLRKKG